MSAHNAILLGIFLFCVAGILVYAAMQKRSGSGPK